MMERRLVVVLAFAFIVLALALAACGGDDEEETRSSPAPSAEAPSGSSAAPSLSAFPPEFLACLEDQGIDLESVTDVSAVIHSPEGRQCFDVLHGE
jgi:hypothetical protein